jgi:hypothetical protein
MIFVYTIDEDKLLLVTCEVTNKKVYTIRQRSMTFDRHAGSIRTMRFDSLDVSHDASPRWVT